MPDKIKPPSIQVYYPKNKLQWRNWLKKNHLKKDAVWLLLYSKSANKPTLSWSEAVDEALCFGWIDSKKIKAGDAITHQFFSKRKASSTWSCINKEKVEKMIKAGLMTEAGFETIRIARENGSWNILDTVEALTIPKDLEIAFKEHEGSKAYFLSLSKSVKKMLLQWIVLAKKEETRQNRINEIALLAGKKMKPKQF